MNSYQNMIDKQLLNVVRDSIRIIEQKGSFYNHEIYLTFSTLPEHSTISPKLRAMYPYKISILLQQNYTELKFIKESDIISIEIALVTGIEKLQIPCNAIIEYIDNTEKFALKFTPYQSKTNNTETENHTTTSNTSTASISTDHNSQSEHSKVIQFKPKTT